MSENMKQKNHRQDSDGKMPIGIKYRCGHVIGAELRDRDRAYLDWCRKRLDCPNCVTRDQGKLLIDAESRLNLPALPVAEGVTEMDVTWARFIRASWLVRLDGARAALPPDGEKLAGKVIELYSGQTALEWWIEHWRSFMGTTDYYNALVGDGPEARGGGLVKTPGGIAKRRPNIPPEIKPAPAMDVYDAAVLCDSAVQLLVKTQLININSDFNPEFPPQGKQH